MNEPRKWDLPTNQQMDTQGFTSDEKARVSACREVQADVKTNDKEEERKRLTERYGRVWDTNQLTEDFSVLGFAAPYVVVERKEDGKKGTLTFQHDPRFYFDFVPDPR